MAKSTFSKTFDTLMELHPGIGTVYNAYKEPEDDLDRVKKAASSSLLESASLRYLEPSKGFESKGAAEKMAGFAGEVAGWLLPFGVASKAAGAAGLAGKTFAGRMTKQAAIGGAMGLVSKPKEGESRLMEGVKGAALFPAFGAAGELLGKSASKAASYIKPKTMMVDPSKGAVAFEKAQKLTDFAKRGGEGKLWDMIPDNFKKMSYKYRPAIKLNKTVKYGGKTYKKGQIIKGEVGQTRGSLAESIGITPADTSTMTFDEVATMEAPYTKGAYGKKFRTDISSGDLLNQEPTKEFLRGTSSSGKGLFGKLRTPEQAEQFQKALFKNLAEKAGLDLSKVKYKSGLGERLLNFNEWGNKVYRETGAPTGEMASDWFRKINTADAGLEINLQKISGLEKVVKEAGVTGAELRNMIQSGEVNDLTKAYTSLTDSLRRSYSQAGGNVGYLEQYVPRRLKVPFSDLASKGRRQTKQLKKFRSTAEYSRAKSPLPDEFYKDDAIGLLKQYANEIRQQELKSLVPQSQQAVQYLRLLGMDGKADDIVKTFSNATGIGKDTTRKLFAVQWIENGKVNLDKAMAVADFQNKDVTEKVYQTAARLMYKSWIGLSPTANIKQALQPYLVGSAEIGPRWVKSGYSTLKSKDKAAQEAWKWAKPQLASPTGVDLAEATMEQKAAGKLGSVGEKVLKVAEAPGNPGQRLFSWQDINRNRASMFHGGRNQFLAEGPSEAVLDGLLKSQRDKVLKIYTTEGLEAAAREYGVIRSLRTNFMYSMADKPLALQEGIARYIPFTTWGRNQWMRFLGDVESGNVNKLAKRIAYPAAMLTAIELATGQSIPRAHPASSLLGVGDVDIMPAVSGPIKELAMGRPGRAAKDLASAVPLANLFIKGKKAIDKGPLRAAGLRKAKGRSIIDLLTPPGGK